MSKKVSVTDPGDVGSIVTMCSCHVKMSPVVGDVDVVPVEVNNDTLSLPEVS